jgi:hypothetical protein
VPRLTQTIIPKTSLVRRLTQLHEQVQKCIARAQTQHLQSLAWAQEAGDLLLSAPVADRPDLWTAAGLGRSNAYNYMRIAKHWDRIDDRAMSINGALRLLKQQRDLTSVDALDRPLPFDKRCVNDQHLGLPIGQCAETSD